MSNYEEKIKIIDELPTSPFDKANYVLTLVAKKPMSCIHLVEKPEEKSLKKIGLPYKIEKNDISLFKYTVYVSSEEELIEKFMESRERRGPRELGKFFGYPESAIDGFCREDRRAKDFIKN